FQHHYSSLQSLHYYYYSLCLVFCALEASRQIHNNWKCYGKHVEMNLNVVICRESALQNADDEGQASAKQVRRKRPAVTDEATEEERPVRHRKTVKNMAEERIKTKRTVFLFLLRKVHPKKTSINAYIVFKEEEYNSADLKWVYIILNHFLPQLDHKRSVFVGNLPYDVMEPPVREHFEDCGNVEAVRLVRDRDSGMIGQYLKIWNLRVQKNLNIEKIIFKVVPVKKEKEQKTPRDRQRGRGGGGEPKQEFRNKTRGQNFMMNPGKKQTQASLFRGETADPTAKRGRGLKKRFKHKKKKPNVHI
uniref:RNA binding motif protein 34 n=1 Tax=Sinocyclocheilus rhinocerous TaxID=307959 RepID=A0A673G360_9TELE